jgi:hypothetical protein
MLRAKDLWKQTEEQRTKRMMAMRPVLAQVASKIKTHVIQHPESPYMVFEVPTYVWGYPLYDIHEAMDYIAVILTEQGFQVWKVEPHSLFISWVKPAKDDAKKVLPPRAEFRPFVYDESAFSFLSQKTDF